MDAMLGYRSIVPIQRIKRKYIFMRRTLFISRIIKLVNRTNIPNDTYGKADAAKFWWKYKQITSHEYELKNQHHRIRSVKHRFNAIFGYIWCLLLEACILICCVDWISFIFATSTRSQRMRVFALCNSLHKPNHRYRFFSLGHSPLGLCWCFVGALWLACMRNSIPQCGRKGRCDSFLSADINCYSVFDCCCCFFLSLYFFSSEFWHKHFIRLQTKTHVNACGDQGMLFILI